MKKSKKSLSRKASSKKSIRAPTSENQNLTLLTSSNILMTNRNNNTLMTQPSGSVKSRIVNGIQIPHISLDPESTMRDRYDNKYS